MEFIKVTDQREPFVALIELHRPKELNALNRQLMEELRDTLLLLDKDDRVRVIILTGNEQAFAAGEGFVKATQEHYSPGIIGPFALQGAFTAGPPKEEFKVFDVSMRIPGSPGTSSTPYSGYLYGEPLSNGQRLARELKQAIESNRLIELLT